jgi:Na+-translocating ferredoxin:NAD+ oxidoreductase RnfC subunit
MTLLGVMELGDLCVHGRTTHIKSGSFERRASEKEKAVTIRGSVEEWMEQQCQEVFEELQQSL